MIQVGLWKKTKCFPVSNGSNVRFFVRLSVYLGFSELGGETCLCDCYIWDNRFPAFNVTTKKKMCHHAVCDGDWANEKYSVQQMLVCVGKIKRKRWNENNVEIDCEVCHYARSPLSVRFNSYSTLFFILYTKQIQVPSGIVTPAEIFNL